MDSSSKITALVLISMLFVSSAAPILDCGSCTPSAPTHKKKPKVPKSPGLLPPIIKPPVDLPPVTLPPIVKPPVTLPPIVKPPITLPPIVKPPVDLPPVTLPPVKPPVELPPVTLPPAIKPPITLPPILKPPVTLPPVTVPPVTVPPITNPPAKGKPCPTPAPGKKATCPIDTLKLGACVDLLGGLVHIGLGDPAVNKCCPIISGLAEIEAAVCLCTTLKLKALNLKLYVPVALQLLITCGKTPPPGYTCSL
ncbi:hypothetical protein M9H77_02222 [Catharanthus roseus]|uniref:Uncharacterized protein n=1 Tax=Catharanthus roseus TaxID=4058 RepID=A0ACC0C7Y4_CATRO|nr:hypothetical protein M9H77_02222 [Catharanthus roseus]